MVQCMMENKWVHCMYVGGRGGIEVYMLYKIVIGYFVSHVILCKIVALNLFCQ